ncbi:MAG TPA: cytochrome c [Gaiellaceae bacterium]|nr:cytochrome c [Gaiellaceae bacterium]
MRALRIAAAAAAALLVAGCGGGSTTATRTGPLPLTPQERHGKRLFVRACGSCHTLADAGTRGGAGPDLDEHPWRAVTVEEVIASGPGLMPAELLRDGDADAVAAYVQAATRR